MKYPWEACRLCWELSHQASSCCAAEVLRVPGNKVNTNPNIVESSMGLHSSPLPHRAARQAPSTMRTCQAQTCCSFKPPEPRLLGPLPPRVRTSAGLALGGPQLPLVRQTSPSPRMKLRRFPLAFLAPEKQISARRVGVEGEGQGSQVKVHTGSEQVCTPSDECSPGRIQDVEHHMMMSAPAGPRSDAN